MLAASGPRIALERAQPVSLCAPSRVQGFKYFSQIIDLIRPERCPQARSRTPGADEVWKVKRTLRNIRGGSDFHCVKIEFLNAKPMSTSSPPSSTVSDRG